MTERVDAHAQQVLVVVGQVSDQVQIIVRPMPKGVAVVHIRVGDSRIGLVVLNDANDAMLTVVVFLLRLHGFDLRNLSIVDIGELCIRS